MSNIGLVTPSGGSRGRWAAGSVRPRPRLVSVLMWEECVTHLCESE
jgi:hypothetical protein